MRNASIPFLLACLLLCAFDCAHGPAARDPAPAPTARDAGSPLDAGVARVPPGCEKSLAGEWQHQDDPSYRYTATDDGREVALLPHRVIEGNDAGFTPADMSIALARTPAGFTGTFKMIESMEGGKRCPATFGAQVVACEPEKITLRIEQSYAVDQNCNRVPTGGPDYAEHVLVRRHVPAPKAVASAKAAAPDAGK